jgi:uncharacterized protein YndB with AHSA1/START domain
VPKTFKVKSIHRFNASPERVYETLLDAAKAKKFMFATVSGKMIRAEIDAKVGGRFVFVERRPGGDAEHYGEYMSLDKPNRIEFRFSVVESLKDSDVVSFDIVTLKQGCEVTVTHDVREEFVHLKERIQEGWDGILDGLGETLRR